MNKKPEIVFFENVKNLVGHDNGNTFKIILKSLNDLDYCVKKEVMKPYNVAKEVMVTKN